MTLCINHYISYSYRLLIGLLRSFSQIAIGQYICYTLMQFLDNERLFSNEIIIQYAENT